MSLNLILLKATIENAKWGLKRILEVQLFEAGVTSASTVEDGLSPSTFG